MNNKPVFIGGEIPPALYAQLLKYQADLQIREQKQIPVAEIIRRAIANLCVVQAFDL